MMGLCTTKRNWWEELSTLPFFYPHISNMDEVNELASRALEMFPNIQGTYFLRPSLTQRGKLTITVNLNPFDVRHYKISVDKSGCYRCCNASEKFQSISELILYHQGHGFRKHDGSESDVRLTYAILRDTFTQSLYDDVRCTNDRCVVWESEEKTDILTEAETRDVCIAACGRFVNRWEPPNNYDNRNNHKVKGTCKQRPNPQTPTSNTVTIKFDSRRMEPKTEKITVTTSVNPTYVCQLKSELDTYILNPRIDNRPPLPAPKPHRKKCVSFAIPEVESSSASQELNEVGEIIYSEPNDHLYINRPSVFITKRPRSSHQICLCGIPHEESTMADGWSLHWCHISRDLFFQNFKGDTRWNLPDETYKKLDNHQKDVIETYRCFTTAD